MNANVCLRSLFIVFLVLIMATLPASANYTVQQLTADSVTFAFSNVRFVDYQERKALSVDFTATVDTLFRNRDIAFAEIELVMYNSDLDNLQIRTVQPSLLNSTNLARVVELSPAGPVLADNKAAVDRISAVRAKSGETQSGSLLFFLPESYLFIHALKYKDATAQIRQATNQYLEVNNFDRDRVREILAGVDIPSEGHFLLFKTYLAMEEFLKLNNSLKKAW